MLTNQRRNLWRRASDDEVESLANLGIDCYLLSGICSVRDQPKQSNSSHDEMRKSRRHPACHASNQVRLS